MSGDRTKVTRLTGPSQDAHDAHDELLSAYVDGVAELSLDERHRIEARLADDAEARAEAEAVRGVLARLRAIEPHGSEPDWAAMERSIRDAVGHDAPRPWWRSWRWMVPGALAAVTAVALLTWARPRTAEPVGEPLAVRDGRDAPAPNAPPVAGHAAASDEVVALWLDGAEVDVALSASDVLGDALATDETAASDEVALLPSSDLAWVDGLDDDAVARAERWLARKKG